MGYSLIRTFGNRCLSAIGGVNRWSPFAGWVQLSAEAAWPPRSTASATLCAQATMRLMIMIMQEIYINSDPVTTWYCFDERHLFFFLGKAQEKLPQIPKWDKKQKVSEFWMFILYQHRSWLNDYQLGLRIMVIFRSECDVYILFSHLPLLLMIWRCNELGPISPVATSTSMD